MPVAEDWFGSYGYVPRVLQLFYANDNDGLGDPGAFRIDKIRDLSPLIRDPQPIEIEWLIEGYPSPDSVDVAFYLTGIDSDNPPVSFEWTLGDGTYERSPTFSHRYKTNESYKVVLKYREYDGLTAWATTEVICGNGASSRQFFFITVGDVMNARRYETDGVISEIGAEGIFDSIRTTIHSVDLAMCNLECPFTAWPYDHQTKEYTFKGQPEYLPAISYAGFNYCALGNNHNLDYMYPGMVETQFLLDSLDLLSSGSGANDSPHQSRIVTNRLTTSLEQQDTMWYSAPAWIAAGGYPTRVMTEDTLLDIEVRIGRAVFWMGNLEDEGAEPWLFNSENEGYTEGDVQNGSRCALITRLAGIISENGTLMTYRIPFDVEKTYTAQGWISTRNANEAALTVRYYYYRTASANLSNQTIGDNIDGSTLGPSIGKN